jgi:hypothetical protein
MVISPDTAEEHFIAFDANFLAQEFDQNAQALSARRDEANRLKACLGAISIHQRNTHLVLPGLGE